MNQFVQMPRCLYDCKNICLFWLVSSCFELYDQENPILLVFTSKGQTTYNVKISAHFSGESAGVCQHMSVWYQRYRHHIWWKWYPARKLHGVSEHLLCIWKRPWIISYLWDPLITFQPLLSTNQSQELLMTFSTLGV